MRPNLNFSHIFTSAKALCQYPCAPEVDPNLHVDWFSRDCAWKIWLSMVWIAVDTAKALGKCRCAKAFSSSIKVPHFPSFLIFDALVRPFPLPHLLHFLHTCPHLLQAYTSFGKPLGVVGFGVDAPNDLLLAPCEVLSFASSP